MMKNISKTAIKAINAYGGEDVWMDKKFIKAEVSANGLAFTLKRRPFFQNALIELDIHQPYIKITPIFQDKDITGILEFNDVRLENESKRIIIERKNARNFFPYGRRLFWWDDLDMAYFANCAFWNYFTLPNLLMNQSIEWIEKKEGILIAKFPKSIPTHSVYQEFRFDIDSGLLIQHNYTVDIISKFANAANVVKEHKLNDEIVYTSRRIVTPQDFSGNALNKPILIDIIVHDFKIES